MNRNALGNSTRRNEPLLSNLALKKTCVVYIANTEKCYRLYMRHLAVMVAGSAIIKA